MEIGIITLFPEMFNLLEFGITGRAIDRKLLTINHWNPREFAKDKYRTVDDRPYGGGPGMLMKVEPLAQAIAAAKKTTAKPVKVIYASPKGRLFNQRAAIEMAQREAIIFVAGRYEGIDERLINTEIDEEWSIGDYVLSGGEFAIMVMVDAITRLIPTALGHADSAAQDSFMNHGLLDCPHYTRPEKINGINVPNVLLSGDHKAINKWRLKQALGNTWLKRPDLLINLELNKEQQELLNEFIKEYK